MFQMVNFQANISIKFGAEMFNLFKKKITANEIAKECISTFAEIVYALEDKTVRDRWLQTEDIDVVRTLVDDGVIDMFIRNNFKSEEFNKKYKKLDEKVPKILS